MLRSRKEGLRDKIARECDRRNRIDWFTRGSHLLSYASRSRDLFDEVKGRGIYRMTKFQI